MWYYWKTCLKSFWYHNSILVQSNHGKRIAPMKFFEWNTLRVLLSRTEKNFIFGFIHDEWNEKWPQSIVWRVSLIESVTICQKELIKLRSRIGIQYCVEPKTSSRNGSKRLFRHSYDLEYTLVWVQIVEDRSIISWCASYRRWNRWDSCGCVKPQFSTLWEWP